MRAIVVGGGIGGLAAAVALRRVGIDTLVLEQASVLEPVGAGLTLSPNAVRALERIGLADRVRAVSARGSELVLRTWRGEPLLTVRLDPPLETLGVHRADLQRVLLDGAGPVRVGARVTGLAERGVELADGSVERGDLVVGADGLDSVVRAHLHGPEAPREAGYVGWRAVAEFEDERLHGRFSETWGCGDRVGLVPLGGGRVYWFVSESGRVREYDAAEPPKGAFERRFADWHEPIPEVIGATPARALSATAILCRKPLRSWGSGPVTLLGDAAHAMTPDLGQGAGQALEDAVVLAATLRDASDVEEGLRRYERERIARTTPIVRRSRQAGRLASASHRLTCALRDRVIRATPARLQRRQQEAILGYTLPEL